MSVDTYWSISRVFCRSFVEGAFIYSLITSSKDCSDARQKIGFFGKKSMFLFSLLCSSLAVLFSVALSVADFYRLVLVAFVFSYFWFKQKKSLRISANSYGSKRSVKCILTGSIILVLAVDSLNTISHLILHMSLVLTGVYDVIRGVGVFYQMYKTSLMLLDLFFIFLVYRFQVFKTKDIKSMSINKWVPISFGLCLASSSYISYTYYIFYDIPLTDQFRTVLLWILALMLPTYWGFYLVIRQLTRVLNLVSNTAEDDSILVWILNPSVIETTHLDIYDSDLFMSTFESKKLVLKQKLKKLGIDNGCKGYSELIFCLFLTRLFIGFKSWSFERDVFEQASLVIDVPLNVLRKNIEDMIEYVWVTSESQDLIDGYYFPYHGRHTCDHKQRPTVEEFLMDIAKSI